MIEEVKLKLYSDPELTHVEAEFTASGTTSPQTIPMSGLDSATRYYAVAYATDDNGVTGQSEPSQFRTLEASVTVSGDVRYGATYDVLQYDVQYTDGDNYTLVAKGVEFSTQMDFHSNVQTFVYPSGATGWQNASPFEANTLYYFRFFSEFEEIGRVYGQPDQNTITTMYAMPVFNIYTNDVGENTAEITITYTGNYPIDYNSLQGSVVGGTGDVISLQLDSLTPTHPETITLSGLDPSTLYEVEVWMRYYDTYAEAYNSFTTAVSQIHNFSFTVAPTYFVDNSLIDFAVTATQNQTVGQRLEIEVIGLDICAVPDFSGHQLGSYEKGNYTSFTCHAEGLNEHRRYYFRPWVETAEYGREYGETQFIESHWDIPIVNITQVSETWNSVIVDVTYSGGLPIPSNGVINVYNSDGETLVRTITADNLVWNGTKSITIPNLSLNTEYVVTYTAAYYSFGDIITATATAHTAADRFKIENVQSWAKNGQHTDIITITYYSPDVLVDVDISHNGEGITEISRTVEGNIYTVVTSGYIWGGEYSVDVVATFDGDITVLNEIEIVVPTEDLSISRTYITTQSFDPSYRGLKGVRRAKKTEEIFNIDSSTLRVYGKNTVNGDIVNFTRNQPLYMSYSSQYNCIFYQDNSSWPAGSYYVGYEIGNVMGQTANTLTEIQVLTTTVVKVFNFTPTDDGFTATVSWSNYYPSSQRYIVVLWNGVEVLRQQATSNPVVVTNLVGGTTYTIHYEYATNEYVEQTFTTTGVQPLNFTMPDGGDLTLTKNGTPAAISLLYSINGAPWSAWNETNGIRTITLAADDTVYIRTTSATSTTFSTGQDNYYTFNSTSTTYGGGDVMSLLCSNPSNATLNNWCFRRLFSGFVNLATSPNISATVGADYALYNMYAGTSITESPELFITSVNRYMCRNIFANCPNINKITVHFTDISATNAIGNWLTGVGETGTIYCPQSLVLPSGASGLPVGWSRVDI